MTPEVSDVDRARYARKRLEDSRALVAQGRLEHAEGHLRRGIAMVPDDPDLQRALARLLENTDRAEEARPYRERADELDPIAPLPDAPAIADSRGIVVVLVSADTDDSPAADLRVREPSGRLPAETLRDRLRVRLPGALFVESDLESMSDARRWLSQYGPRAVLSLRVDRSYCAESIKDGAIAVAWLRVAAQTAAGASAPVQTLRSVVEDPGPSPACQRRALERALERVFDEPSTMTILAAAPPDATPAVASAQPWPHDAVRALFPRIGAKIGEQIEVGRVNLASGEIGLAAEAFQRAVDFDPEDPYSLAYLNEAEITLSMLRQLADRRTARRGVEAPARVDAIDPRLSASQTAAAEARLAEENRRRDDLLAALAVLDEDVEMPSEQLLATLRPTSIRDPDGFGPSEARRRAGGDVVARAAYTPGGDVLAKYYYATAGGSPVVREEDTNGDTRPDRWIGYRGPNRAEIWEDSRGRGRPDRHFVFAPGGSPLVRIEIDRDGDARPERVFLYSDGQLASENRDTDGDGTIDCFDRFDADGTVVERAEDLNGDGKIDVRDTFREGRLVRREIADPDVVSRARPTREGSIP